MRKPIKCERDICLELGLLGEVDMTVGITRYPPGSGGDDEPNAIFGVDYIDCLTVPDIFDLYQEDGPLAEAIDDLVRDEL